MEDRYEEMSRETFEKYIADKFRKEMGDLKDTLYKKEWKKSQSVDSVSGNVQRISDILQSVVDRKLPLSPDVYNIPINDLLRVGELTRTEIPLDLIEMLISAGWVMNERCYETCLDVAIEYRHYNVARLMVKHGAKCNQLTRSLTHMTTDPNVPLDMFGLLLASSQNLNYVRRKNGMPLHHGVFLGHTATALHLIKLGTSINQKDWWCMLPVEYFVKHLGTSFNSELFMVLLPSVGHGTSFLRPLCNILMKI